MNKITKETNDLIRLKLIYLRKKNNLSQVELADKIGINNKHLYNFEKGRTVINLELLLAYSKEFGVSLDWICGVSNDSNVSLINLKSILEINDDSPLELSVQKARVLLTLLENKKDVEVVISLLEFIFFKNNTEVNQVIADLISKCI